jgi:hypothetical protein
MNENFQNELLHDRINTYTQSVLPPQLVLNSEKTQTINPIYKEIKYSPNTGNSYTNGNIIRFLLNSTGFIDPYGTYLSFNIKNPNPYPLKFDNSAHSLISSIVISTNGVVLEEINDYDVVMSYLNDSTFGIKERKLCKDLCFGYNEDYDTIASNEKILYPENILTSTVVPTFNVQSRIETNFDSYLNRCHVNHAIDNSIMNQDEDIITKNGVVYTWYPQSEISIQLPLMSNIFGFGLSLQNYKWFPLELFPNLEFTIKLNEAALYIPLPCEIEYMRLNLLVKPNDNSLVKEDIESWGLSGNNLEPRNDGLTGNANAMNEAKILNYNQCLDLYNHYSGKKRKYEIYNVHLCTTQIYFDSQLLQVIRSNVYSNGLILETQMYNSFQHKIFKDRPENTYVLNVPRKSIRNITTLFLNREYENNPLYRKLNRYSRGIIKFQVKIGDNAYPVQPLIGFAGDTIGKDCCSTNKAFFDSWKKVYSKLMYSSIAETVITQENFASDVTKADILKRHKQNNITDFDSYKEAIILNEYTKIRNYGNIGAAALGDNNYIILQKKPYKYNKEIVGRALFTVSLDSIPMSGNLYKSGVDTRFTKPILIEIDQSSGYSELVNNYTQYLQYVILEFDYTLKVSNTGMILRDF